MKQQIELTLGGKKRKFTFGILMTGNLLERKEFDNDYGYLIQIMSKNPFKFGHIVMFESLVNTCNKYKKEVDFTELDCLQWLEDDYKNGSPALIKFTQTFLGTNENRTPEESDDSQEKKETPKKK
tara:strand:+ start:460 stop:834 length:375 start_codon:yes stop_codon:yes gene_type:complete